MAGSDQPIIQKLLDKLKDELNNPASGDMYLPNIIKSEGYDPYKPKDPWNVDPLSGPGGESAAGNICSGVYNSRGEFGIPTPTAPLPNLSLTDVIIQGISEMLVVTMTSSGDNGFDISMVLSASQNITINGQFTLHQSCCQTTDHKTCSAASEDEHATGTFTATLAVSTKANLTIETIITALAKNELTFEANPSFKFPVKFNADLSAITITADVSHLAKYWQQSVDEALSASYTKQSIIAQVNVQLQNPDFLKKLGTNLTKRVDDYLRKNNKYPFNDSFASLF